MMKYQTCIWSLFILLFVVAALNAGPVHPTRPTNDNEATESNEMLEKLRKASNIAEDIKQLLIQRFNDSSATFLKEKSKTKNEEDHSVLNGLQKLLSDTLKKLVGMSKNLTKENIGKEFSWMENLKKNIKMVEDHNKLYDAGNKTFRMRINPYSHMSFEEFSQTMLGIKNDQEDDHHNKNSTKFEKNNQQVNSQVPDHFDWRKRNVVTPVKQQGSCGSCWAFATNAALESHRAIKGHKLEDLSEQILVDCVKLCNPLGGCRIGHGCEGATTSAAWDMIKKDGVVHERDYPYEMRDDQCRKNAMNRQEFIKIRDYKIIQGQDEEEMKRVVAEIGPVAVQMLVSPEFMHYDGRVGPDNHIQILDDDYCKQAEHGMSPVKLQGHAVTIVGYGSDPQRGDYWIIKNSHGKQYGDGGYFYMKRGVNMCQVAQIPNYPILE